MTTHEFATPDPIHLPTLFELIDDSAETTLLAAELGYTPTDPFAVTATFETARGPVTWMFARELLLVGMLEPTGDGDVHIWPTLTARGRAAAMFDLCAPEGSALLRIDCAPLMQFLALTYACVAPGAEPAHLDVGALVDDILAWGDTLDSGAVKESASRSTEAPSE